jgi:putative hydrolase of the HAD superfamily
MTGIRMVGFDADDTLWRSQDYFEEAQAEFEAIVAPHVGADARAMERLAECEACNIAVFGYGVKGMALSMVESAIEVSGGRIPSADIGRIVALAKSMLRHPVELLPGIRDAVEAVAAHHHVVLVTKGDLFHQEAKVRDSGLATLFRRIEIVSEKDPATYRRLLEEFGITPGQFLMVGNSLRSDIAPVLALGGWGVHMPYHVTWAHEREGAVGEGDRARLRVVEGAAGIPAAVAELDALARG